MTHIFADIWVPGIPRAGGSKKAVKNPKTGQAIIVEAGGQRTADWRSAVKHFAYNNYQGDPLDEPLRVIFRFVFPRPKTHYRGTNVTGTIKANAPNFKETRPDTTKLIRPVEDACTGILWVDDARIVQQVGSKWWGVKPGMRLLVMSPKLPSPNVS